MPPSRLEERIAAILYEHVPYPWPGPIKGPGRQEVRCPKCGVLAASDYSISPLVVGSAHQAALVMKLLLG